MFEHDKYTPVGEEDVIHEFIKEMDRINGDLWHMQYMSDATLAHYQDTIKSVNEERAIAAKAIAKLEIAHEMVNRHRSMLICFWRALLSMRVTEITYTEEESRNMKHWLDHNKRSIQ